MWPSNCKQRARRTMLGICLASLLLALSAPLPSSAQSCKLPPLGRPILLPLDDEQDAVLEARCHAACAEKLLNESLVTGLASIWPTISLTSISQLGNCEDVKQVMECRRGCVTALKSPHLFLNECRYDCEEDCNAVCTGRSNCNPNYDGTSCARNCLPASYCDSGCQLAHNVNYTNTSLEASGGISHQPTGILSLRKTSLNDTRRLDAGVFDLIYDVPPAENTGDLVVFVFRVELNNSRKYIVQASLSDPLDLSYFACEHVNVSFAVVNKNSTMDDLNFSPQAEIFVHGESDPPSQITGLNFDQVFEILTDDFYGSGRGIINMSWSRPPGFEQLSHYIIEVYSTFPSCHDPRDEIEIGGQRFANKTFIVDKDETNLVIRAETPFDLPAFRSPTSCTYTFIVRSQPHRDPQSIFFTLFEMRIIRGAPPIEQSIECVREVDKTFGKIRVTISWKADFSHLPSTYYNDTLDFTVVSAFRAMADSSYDDLDYRRQLPNLGLYTSGQMVKDVSSGHFISQSGSNGTSIATVFEVRANGSGFVSIFGLPPAPADNEFDHTLLLLQNHVKRPFTYRLSQFLHTNHCVVDTRPLSPDPVEKNTVNISAFEISDTTNINLTISWLHPNATFGFITAYEVIVTKDPLVGQESAVSSASVIFSSSGAINNIFNDQFMQIEIGDSLDIPYREEENPCLFVQVSIQNEFSRRSDWSDPIPVARNSSFLEQCLFRVVNSNETTTTEVEVPRPFIDDHWIGIGVGVGLLLAVVVVVILAICIPVCVNYRRKRKLFRSLSHAPIISTTKGQRVTWRGMVAQRYQPVDGWEIPSASIILEEQLGEGCFGEVHRGVVKGPLPTTHMMKSAICKTVAVKFLKRFASGPERKDFINEIGLMKTIAEGNSPHVISLIGCVTEREPLCLITEFLPFGDLLSYLHTIRKMLKQALDDTHRYHSADSGYPASQEFSPDGSGYLPMVSGTGGSSGIGNGQSSYKAYDHLEPPPAKFSAYDHLVPPEQSPYAALGGVGEVDLTSFAYQIASGMEYVASLDIVHRDLACRNVLVGDGKVLKIADFGMSRVVDSEDPVYVKTTKGRLPWKWMAIESIVYRKFTSASDVWSYGITLWEIATLGGFPYPSVVNDDLLTFLRSGGRLDKPDGCNEIVYDTMKECWSEEPDDRPTFAELKSRFDQMLLQNNHYILFSNYVATTGNPSGYDHLPNPAAITNLPPQNGANQTHTHRTKPAASRTLSAPLLDAELESANVPSILRSATNSYVQPPTKYRIRNEGGIVVENGGGMRNDKRVIGAEKKKKVNAEMKRPAHVRVAAINSINTSEFDGYDRLEQPAVGGEQTFGSYVGYDHLQV